MQTCFRDNYFSVARKITTKIWWWFVTWKMRVDLAVYCFAFVCVSAWSTEENSIASSSVPDYNLLRPCVTMHNLQVSEWRKKTLWLQQSSIQTIRFTSNRIRHPLRTLMLWRSLCLELPRQRFGPGRKKVHGSVSARAGRKFTAAFRPGQEESSRQRFGPGRKKVHGSVSARAGRKFTAAASSILNGATITERPRGLEMVTVTRGSVSASEKARVSAAQESKPVSSTCFSFTTYSSHPDFWCRPHFGVLFPSWLLISSPVRMQLSLYYFYWQLLWTFWYSQNLGQFHNMFYLSKATLYASHWEDLTSYYCRTFSGSAVTKLF